MESAPSYRHANRSRLRDALVSAARALAVERGWENVRMVDVALAAGVSRQTVYNEFDGRVGLAEALALQEIQEFTTEVRVRLSGHGADVRAGAHAAILYTLDEAAGNPLIRAVVTSSRGGADLLPYLTTRSDVVLSAVGQVVQDWLVGARPGVDGAVVAVAAESIIRLTVSHIVLASQSPADTASALADVLVRLIAPAAG